MNANPSPAGPRKLRFGAWTEADILTLIRLWPEKDIHEIAKILARNGNAVSIKASRLGLPPRSRVSELDEVSRRRQKKMTTRPCLKCRVPFFSEGAHHRICDGCKTSESWRAGNGHYVIEIG